jgi:hypothetical protein
LRAWYNPQVPDIQDESEQFWNKNKGFKKIKNIRGTHLGDENIVIAPDIRDGGGSGTRGNEPMSSEDPGYCDVSTISITSKRKESLPPGEITRRFVKIARLFNECIELFPSTEEHTGSIGDMEITVTLTL